MLTAFLLGSILIGIILVRIFDHIRYIVNYYRTRDNYPRSKPYNPKTMCLQHDWKPATLVLNDLEVKEYHVCFECGFVGGTKRQLNKPGLEVLRNNTKIKEEVKNLSESRVKRFTEIVQADYTMWTKTYSKEFSKDEDTNKVLLSKFFADTIESVNGAHERVDRELPRRK